MSRCHQVCQLGGEWAGTVFEGRDQLARLLGVDTVGVVDELGVLSGALLTVPPRPLPRPAGKSWYLHNDHQASAAARLSFSPIQEALRLGMMSGYGGGDLTVHFFSDHLNGYHNLNPTYHKAWVLLLQSPYMKLAVRTTTLKPPSYFLPPDDEGP